MKEQNKIPTGKGSRASKFIGAGLKVGGNYLKHFGKKIVSRNSEFDLHESNANDLYDALSKLKGSALKVAQMLSMNEVLPAAYNDKFALAQNSAPPLSYPLVVKTFQKNFGKHPEEMFDDFTRKAVNAASIGQVHQAVLNGKKLAVKVQYPGVADSVKSDLNMVRPFASALFNVSKQEINYYLSEVEEKLLEETDYAIEIKQSIELSNACKHIENTVFPEYFPDFSSKQIITLSWIDGKSLKEFLETNPNQETRNLLGQAMWDFYSYQIHHLRKVHADPHPGNFIITPDNKLGILDFGCVKEIPDDFYDPYFKLVQLDLDTQWEQVLEVFYEMEMLLEKDTEQEKELFSKMFREMIALVGQPFKTDQFDFGNDAFFQSIYDLGESFGKEHHKELRRANAARGKKDAIYINRTFFGLYAILNQLKANVKTRLFV